MGWLFDAIRRWRFRRSRQLFRFFDGERTRRIDPARAWLAILDDPTFSFDTDVDAALAGQEPAYTTYIELLCRHMGVTRYDPATERGLTNDEVLTLGDDFLGYLMAQKKTSSPTPTSPASLEPTPRVASSPAAMPSSPSASGSPSIESATGGPGTPGEPLSNRSATSATPGLPSTTPATASPQPTSPSPSAGPVSGGAEGALTSVRSAPASCHL